jgi:hypothetical protein
MGVNHGGSHILVAQELLNRADIVTILKQMCGKRMTEGVTGGILGDLRFHDGLLHSFL